MLIKYAIIDENWSVLAAMDKYLPLTEKERNVVEPKLVEWKLLGIMDAG